MERFPVELLYVLGFIAVVLFNFIAQRRARRGQQEEAQLPAPPLEEAAVPAPSPSADLGDDVWGRTPAPAPAPKTLLAPPAPPPAPRRMHPARALLNDKRDLRRAVVLMMILGPCRAQESDH